MRYRTKQRFIWVFIESDAESAYTIFVQNAKVSLIILVEPVMNIKGIKKFLSAFIVMKRLKKVVIIHREKTSVGQIHVQHLLKLLASKENLVVTDVVASKMKNNVCLVSIKSAYAMNLLMKKIRTVL